MLNEDGKSSNTEGTEEPWVNQQARDTGEIERLFEDGDRALVSGDVAELERIYADDYVQYEERGRALDRQELIVNLKSGQVRFISMVSTGRSIRFLHDDVAVVHGSERDEIERDGEISHVAYVYTDVVVRRGGRWQISASQLARA